MSLAAPPMKKKDKEQKIRKVILRTLRTYPLLSATMIGNHTRPYDVNWREVLEKMVEEGSVIRKTQKVDRRFVFVYYLPGQSESSGISNSNKSAAEETEEEEDLKAVI